MNDAARNTAGVTQVLINTMIYSNLSIRGILISNYTNVRWNGVLSVVNLIEQPIEIKDPVELRKGAAGHYCGFANPSGIVNLVTERPTAAALTKVDVQGNGNGTIGATFHVSRRFGPTGARVNAGSDIPETGVTRISGERDFVTGAFDGQLADGRRLSCKRDDASAKPQPVHSSMCFQNG